MQVVILAAGKGTRLYPLKRPKSLIPIANKPILEHACEQLDGVAEEVIIVVGHEKTTIQEHMEKIKNRFPFSISFVEQKEQAGTYDALLQARSLLKERFVAMNGDDLYSKADILSSLKNNLCILAKEVSDPPRFGILEVVNGMLKKIIEKPSSPPSTLANTGLYVLDKDVFSEPKKSERGELELTDAVNALAQKKKISVIQSEFWMPIGYPWDLLEANEVFLKNIKSSVHGEIEKNAVLKNSVSVGKGTLIKSGAYIEGPVVIGENCIIGPNCFIRPFTSIGNNCRIGNAVEIKNCMIGDNVSIGHLSYFGDSIFGDNINIGAGTIAANLRHDQQTIKVNVQGKSVDTGRRKFGVVIGDGVHTGIHTSLYPGRLLGRNTLPGEIIK